MAETNPPGGDLEDLDGLDRVGIRQARSSISGLVARAGAGERIVITVDGRPVAQLGPLGQPGAPTLDDLASAGLVEAPRQTPAAGGIGDAGHESTTGDPHSLPPPIAAVPADVGLDRLLDQIRGRRR